MPDPRDVKLAELLVNYSIDLKKGENVYLLTDSVETLPLFLEVYKKIISVGGYPYPHILLDPHLSAEAFDYIWMKYASEEQLHHFSEIKYHEMKAMHAYIRIGGPANKQHLAGISRERIALRQKVTKPILDERLRKKWVVTRYPTPSMAQAANMSTEDFINFYYNACLIDWQQQEQLQEKIKNVFEKGKIIRIIGENTDLRFSIEHRKVIKCYGKCKHLADLGIWEGCNMPDGEIYIAPVENSAEGYIKYTYPYNKEGEIISGIFFRFEHGKIVEYKAEVNQEALKIMLETDEGAKRIGEFGIGTNDGIQRFVNDVLFDEKIAGTVHVTPGNAYEGSGGLNKSAVHADIVKDLRKEYGGGEIQVDGETVQKDGKWTFL